MKHVPLLLALALAASCEAPIALQAPLEARDAQSWRAAGRFRSSARAPQAAPGDGRIASPTAGGGGGWPSQPPLAAPQDPFGPAPQAPLLDWGGGVVEPPREGEIRTVAGEPTRGLQESVEGRMHIIELYQAVLDERDQLLTEVDALQAALSKSQEALDVTRGGNAELGTQVQALLEAKRALTEENHTLAQRLATAQIRRLEAEKLLLETQLAWHREKAARSPGAQATAAASEGR